jgi:hypothetical protein
MNVETQTGNARKLSRRELASLSRGNKAAKKASEMLARQTAWEQLITADAKAQKGATWAAGELRRAVVQILGVNKNTVSMYLNHKYYHNHRSDRILKAAAAFDTALQNKIQNDSNTGR